MGSDIISAQLSPSTQRKLGAIRRAEGSHDSAALDKLVSQAKVALSECTDRDGFDVSCDDEATVLDAATHAKERDAGTKDAWASLAKLGVALFVGRKGL